MIRTLQTTTVVVFFSASRTLFPVAALLARSAFNSQIAFRCVGGTTTKKKKKVHHSPTPKPVERHFIPFAVADTISPLSLSFAAAHFRPAENNNMILASAQRVTKLPNARRIVRRVLRAADGSIFAISSSYFGENTERALYSTENAVSDSQCHFCRCCAFDTIVALLFAIFIVL